MRFTRRIFCFPGNQDHARLPGDEFSTLPAISLSGKPDYLLADMAAKTKQAAFASRDNGLPGLVYKINESRILVVDSVNTQAPSMEFIDRSIMFRQCLNIEFSKFQCIRTHLHSLSAIIDESF